jgi:hypothetical protein
MVIWNDHGQPDDARSDEYRGVGAGSHLLHAFEQRIQVLDARPNPKIAALDFAQDAVKSPRQVAGELGEVQRRIAQVIGPRSAEEVCQYFKINLHEFVDAGLAHFDDHLSTIEKLCDVHLADRSTRQRRLVKEGEYAIGRGSQIFSNDVGNNVFGQRRNQILKLCEFCAIDFGKQVSADRSAQRRKRRRAPLRFAPPVTAPLSLAGEGVGRRAFRQDFEGLRRVGQDGAI